MRAIVKYNMSQVEVKFYTVTKDAWQSMLEDIKNATRSIDIEQYIFSADKIGHQFIHLLKKKAEEGVKVRVLCDMIGSLSLYRSNIKSVFGDKIEVKFFNPVKLWRVTNFTSNFFRDHRKIMIVDSVVAHVGGVGIQDEFEMWRDTHVRISGSIVPVVDRIFEKMWDATKRSIFIKFDREFSLDGYEILTNSPMFGQRHIYHEIINKIRKSKKRIFLTTPYFIPDIPFYQALRRAVRRGVEVKILVPSMADHVFINHARESYFTIALRAGMKIYTYDPIMLHAKTVVVDDWATLGSFNLDNLSFYFNHEVNVASSEPVFVKEMAGNFEEDITTSKEVLIEEWVQRSWQKKFLELLTWPFHGIM